jgi:DNA-binding response OmpR family regulator
MTDENGEKKMEDPQVNAVGEKIKILVVEDSPNINLLYGRGLPDIIFEKRFAPNGHDALVIYKDWLPDIIILDVMLPVMTGYSVLKEIRNTFKDKSTTIIMSTSLSKKEDVTSMMKLGIQGYIVKPFGVREIGGRILKYYEKIDPARAAAAFVFYEKFLEELIRATFKKDEPPEEAEKSGDGKETQSEENKD